MQDTCKGSVSARESTITGAEKNILYKSLNIIIIIIFVINQIGRSIKTLQMLLSTIHLKKIGTAGNGDSIHEECIPHIIEK